MAAAKLPYERRLSGQASPAKKDGTLPGTGPGESESLSKRDLRHRSRGHTVKFCVSEIRQSQVWCSENSTECGLKPFLSHHPGGPDGMRAGGVNAVRFAGIF